MIECDNKYIFLTQDEINVIDIIKKGENIVGEKEAKKLLIIG